MRSPLEFVVLGLPKPAGSKRAFAIRKGGMPTGKIAVVDDCNMSREWKNNVAHEAAVAIGNAEKFIGPVKLSATFRVPRPKSHYRTGSHAALLRQSAPPFPVTKPDLLKLTRAIEDAMTGIVWRDDSQVVEQSLKKIYGEPIGCAITITEKNE
jgi:Holliday junction resolvase RusA-like endonuclease